MDDNEKIVKLIHEFAHDIRNPLSVVKEGIALVHDGTLGEINKEQASTLSLALTGVEKVHGVINEYYKKYGVL